MYTWIVFIWRIPLILIELNQVTTPLPPTSNLQEIIIYFTSVCMTKYSKKWTDKETKHSKDRNVESQGYSEHENTNIKTGVYHLNLGEQEGKQQGQQKSTLGSEIKLLCTENKLRKYRENKLYKLNNTMRHT